MFKGVIAANPAAAIETAAFDVIINNDYKPVISGYEKKFGIAIPDSGEEVAQGAFTIKDMVNANTVDAYFSIIDPKDLAIIHGILTAYLKYVEVVKSEYNFDDELKVFIEECKAFELALRPKITMWDKHIEDSLPAPVNIHTILTPRDV